MAQSVGMDYVEPFTFNGIRCLIGSLVLLPCIFFFDRFKTSEEKEAVKSSRKTLWIGGILCGAILFVATNAQQIGIQYTSAGKAGFITALYIVFVPIIGIFLKKKCSWNVWVSVVIAVIGFYLLCVKDGLSLSKGDLWVLVCAGFSISYLDSKPFCTNGRWCQIVLYTIFSLWNPLRDLHVLY